MHEGECYAQSLEQRRQAEERRREMYLEFYVEVVRRTFQLAAAWQCVGFCHGVSITPFSRNTSPPNIPSAWLLRRWHCCSF